MPDLPPYAGKTRSGEKIESLQPHQVFVFGANNQGTHDGGNASAAKRDFGAIDGKAGGYHGQGAKGGTSYGIVTTLIDPAGNNVPNNHAEIEKQIKALYAEAEKHPEREYLIGYTDKGGKPGALDTGPHVEMLSGYSPRELATLFQSAGEGDAMTIPPNIVFHEKFAKLFPF